MLGLRIHHPEWPRPQTVPTIESELTLGSLPSSDGVLDDPSIAPLHGRLSWMEGAWFFLPARMQAAYLEGVRVRTPVELEHGARLTLGPFTVVTCPPPALPHTLPHAHPVAAARLDRRRVRELARHDADARAALYLDARRRDDLDTVLQALSLCAPHPSVWNAICHVLEARSPPSAQASPLEAALELWPDALRATPHLWRERLGRQSEARLRWVRRLVFTTRDDRVAQRLERASELTDVAQLVLTNQALSDDALHRITQRTWRVRELDLSCNALTCAGVETLVKSTWFEGLERLDLANNAIGDEGAMRLAEAPRARALRYLNLRRNQLSSQGVEALEGSPHLAVGALVAA